jgi:hypothetical protein
MIAPHTHTHCGRVWSPDEIIEQSCEECPYPMREADAFFTLHEEKLSEPDVVAMMLIEGRYTFDRPQVDRGTARSDVGQVEAA